MAKKKIPLKTSKGELTFDVTTDNYNRFINETSPTSKVIPMKQFLRRSLADSKQRELLDELIDYGHHAALVGKLIEEFTGELEIEVKK